MGKINIILDMEKESAADLVKGYSFASRLRNVSALLQLFRSIAMGVRSARMDSYTGGVAASSTLTLDTVVEDETATIGGVVLTFKNTPSGESQVDVGGSDTISATNLAAAINAHSELKGMVTATSAAAVVTVSCAQAGLIGNGISLAGSTQITAAAANLASGTNGTVRTQYFGSQNS